MTSQAEAQRFHPTCPPRRARGGARWGVESRRNEVRLSRRGAGFVARRRTPHHRRPACSAPTLRLAVSGGFSCRKKGKPRVQRPRARESLVRDAKPPWVWGFQTREIRLNKRGRNGNLPG